MSDDYSVKYTKAPGMMITIHCEGSACGDTVSHDGDSFVCSSCGTTWDGEDSDGTLYEEWSGYGREGEAIDPDDFEAGLEHRFNRKKARGNRLRAEETA